MNSQTVKTEQLCPYQEISLYLDGELSPHEEIGLEKHLADCEKCLTELNLQKQMLTALDFAFDKHEEIVLPENFTKVVVAKAESGVSGLRSKEERFRAFFLCATLFLLIILGLGAESEQVFNAFANFGNRFMAIAGFVFHLTYDITIGVAVVLRSLSQQFVFSSIFTVLLVGFGFSILFLMLSRFIYKINRPKTS